VCFGILLARGENLEGLVGLGPRVGKLHIVAKKKVRSLGEGWYMWKVTHVGRCFEMVCKKVYGGGGVVFENMVIEGYVGGMDHRYMVVKVYNQDEIHHILGLAMQIGEGFAHCSIEEVAPPKINAPIPRCNPKLKLSSPTK